MGVVVSCCIHCLQRVCNSLYLRAKENMRGVNEEKVEEEEEVVSVFPPLSNASIREAVRLWRVDQAQATEKYNHINKWNTSQVTNINMLFLNDKDFNDNISEWDVSNVTNMNHMFYHASSFNQDVSGWDMSNVTNMSYMFYYASSFNQDVSSWDVSNVTNMSYMFCEAPSFNQDVSSWDVSNVTNMSHMFSQASSFNQDVSGWDVSNVTNMSYMFCGASSFNQDVSRWNVSSVTFLKHTFDGTVILSELKRINSDISSFFAGRFRCMSPAKRGRFFKAAFRWLRRKDFVMFLVGHGHVASVLSTTGGVSGAISSCDKLFDVEDLYREVCKYL